MLLYHHTVHKNCEAMVLKTLEERSIETRLVTRFEYNETNISWADVVFTTGGDGTFLLGASRIHDPKKALIGFNSDPTRSEGYLCLPKKYSNNIADAVDKLLQVLRRSKPLHSNEIVYDFVFFLFRASSGGFSGNV